MIAFASFFCLSIVEKELLGNIWSKHILTIVKCSGATSDIYFSKKSNNEQSIEVEYQSAYAKALLY